ncbi:RNA-binding S4 domain-containing protein [Paracoccus bogoriensis]|uniref:RNA-binding S4 domain-containing protein n=1 Tax=Paracoccus bogoriensis TaxID=242065 RepID=UPI001CA56D1A|nr:RNA-binding S4 domain-containing protein [Paracoccus bogoriensis]
MQQAANPGLRLDKWLFQARVFKSRALAADRIAGGGIRVNGQPCFKPHRTVRPGDEVVISAHGRVRVLQVIELGHRRGPAGEAQGLYRDLSDGLIDPSGGTK